ncbi:hypothetical protein [Winogradskyella sp.]|uniref:hypothetical protein n=1 Tax=Winogradskyella sp. TaxID=1883156 RepID=UPI003F6D7038
MKISQKTLIYIGIAFLLIQLSSIIYARFIPERFFCWAPYDEHSYYEINVTINGKRLSEYDVQNRYRYTSKGWEPRCMYNVFSIVKQYEETYGMDDNASVEIVYSTNGHKEKRWKH